MWANLILQCMPTIISLFYVFNTECPSPIFNLDYTRWCSFTLITHLVTKANVAEGGPTSTVWLYYQRNQSTHVTDGVTVPLLSTSLQQIVCQIPLNEKLSRKFIKLCTFLSLVKTKSPKVRPAYIRKYRSERVKKFSSLSYLIFTTLSVNGLKF